MKDLLEALNIFMQYMVVDSYEYNYPFNCSHDELWVNVDADKVSDEDKERLDELGFFVNTEYGSGFSSFRYGSC